MSVKELRELEAASEMAWDDGEEARAEMLGEDAHSLRKRIGLVPAGGMDGRVPDDLPACETCVDVVYIDRQGEERPETMRADLAQDFTDRKGLRECRECSKLCLPVLYEDYEDGHTEHTCYLCDFEWMVRDGTQVDPTGKSGAELAAEYAHRQDSYYRAASPVSAVRKVWEGSTEMKVREPAAGPLGI